MTKEPHGTAGLLHKIKLAGGLEKCKTDFADKNFCHGALTVIGIILLTHGVRILSDRINSLETKAEKLWKDNVN